MRNLPEFRHAPVNSVYSRFRKSTASMRSSHGKGEYAPRGAPVRRRANGIKRSTTIRTPHPRRQTASLRRRSHPPQGQAGLPACGAGSPINRGAAACCSCADDDGSAVVWDGSGVGVGVCGGGVGDGVSRGAVGFAGGVPREGGAFGVGVSFEEGAPRDAEADGAPDSPAGAEPSRPAEAPGARAPTPPAPPAPPEITVPPSGAAPPPRCAAECEGAGGRPSSATLMHPAAAATATVVAARRLSRRAQSGTGSWRTGEHLRARDGVTCPNSGAPQEDTRRVRTAQSPHKARCEDPYEDPYEERPGPRPLSRTRARAAARRRYRSGARSRARRNTRKTPCPTWDLG